MKHRGRRKTEESVYTKVSPFQERRNCCCTEVSSKKETIGLYVGIEVLVQQIESYLIVSQAVSSLIKDAVFQGKA